MRVVRAAACVPLLIQPMQNQIQPDITAEAVRIVQAGTAQNINLRLLGGLAIRLQAPSAAHRSLARTYPDIDLATDAPSHAVESLLTRLGYSGDREFNVLNGTSRLLFYDPFHARQIDIFVGQFDMCHRLPLAARLRYDPLTLPLAELLLTKLQIVQMNDKDLRDICALLLDHPISATDAGALNRTRMAELCGKDWGLWKTVMLSFDKVARFCQTLELDQSAAQQILQRVHELRSALEAAPKSLGWKARAAIGERVIWYNLPEEVRRD